VPSTRGSATCANSSPVVRQRPGGVRAQGLRGLAFDDGVERVVEPQLDLAADDRLQPHVQVGPPAGGQHQVHPVPQAARPDVLHHLDEVLEVALEHRVVVDDQDDVGGGEFG
jgi:hypothetical protein